MQTSKLKQWPVQIKLIMEEHPEFDNAHLLIAADCSAFAYADFHKDFMEGKVTLIGCPKLDDVDYALKLTNIIKNNNIKEITVIRMEVPCCGGISYAVKSALKNSGKTLKLNEVVLSVTGEIIE